MKDRKELFNKFFSAGFEQVNRGDAGYAHHFEFYAKNFGSFLPESKKAKILDIGCGLGQFLFYIDKIGYINYEGVEISKEMYDYTRTNVTKKVKLISDLEWYLKRKKDTFDLIVFNDVIEHWEKEKVIPYLKLIRSALKKNGRVLIKTNNVAASTGARMRFEDFTHEWSFTPYSLRQVMLVSGFKEVEIKSFLLPLNSPFRLFRRILQVVLHLIWRLVYWTEYTTQPEVVHEFMYVTARK